MDLSYTADEQQFRTEVRSFLDANLAPDLSAKVLGGNFLRALVGRNAISRRAT